MGKKIERELSTIQVHHARRRLLNPSPRPPQKNNGKLFFQRCVTVLLHNNVATRFRDIEDGVFVCHGLRFSKFSKCPPGVASVSTFTLPDGALPVQEHATGSAFDGFPCLRERIFS